MKIPGARSIAIILLGLLAPGLQAQSKKGGPSLTWNNEIRVTPEQLAHLDTVLQGHGFTVYETDAKTLLGIWRNDLAGVSKAVVNSKPAFATGANIDAVAEGPVDVVAAATSDKRTGNARLVVAFKPAADGSLKDQQAQEQYVHDMAVRYNKEVINKQIEAQERSMGRAGSKAEKSGSQQAKLEKKLSKERSKLDKVKASRTKEQARNAKYQGEVVGAESKFNLTNDPKDLKRLTKARARLADGELKVAKVMEQEVKLQANVNKYEAQLPEATREAEGLQAKHDAEQKKLDALRLKLEQVR